MYKRQDLICQLKGDNRPGALFRLKEKTHIRPGQTKKVDVYYPQPTADRDNYAYLVEAADEEGRARDPDEELRVDVLQGVLPLQAGQQGYGGTLQLLLINNSDDKVVINQNSIVARGTVVKVAPAQSNVINMVRGKPPPAGTAEQRTTPTERPVPQPVKVGTKLSSEARQLCEELQLKERFHLKGNKPVSYTHLTLPTKA